MSDSMFESWWNELRTNVIPVDASPVQLRDMRIAFCIGVRECLVFLGSLKRTEENRRVLERLVTEASEALAASVDFTGDPR